MYLSNILNASLYSPPSISSPPCAFNKSWANCFVATFLPAPVLDAVAAPTAVAKAKVAFAVSCLASFVVLLLLLLLLLLLSPLLLLLLLPLLHRHQLFVFEKSHDDGTRRRVAIRPCHQPQLWGHYFSAIDIHIVLGE